MMQGKPVVGSSNCILSGSLSHGPLGQFNALRSMVVYVFVFIVVVLHLVEYYFGVVRLRCQAKAVAAAKGSDRAVDKNCTCADGFRMFHATAQLDRFDEFDVHDAKREENRYDERLAGGGG